MREHSIPHRIIHGPPRRARRTARRLRTAWEEARDHRRLARVAPDALDPRAIAACAEELRALHAHYAEHVSHPEHAVSLELAAQLLHLCRTRRPSILMDTGSGFSSYVFRTYQAEADHDVTVISVDTDPTWLGKTRAFLAEHGLSTEHLVTWDEIAERRFEVDLLLHDMGTRWVRAETLPIVSAWVRAGGSIVFDDQHFPEYAPQVRRLTRRAGIAHFSLRRTTRDRFNRWSSLGIVPGGDA